VEDRQLPHNLLCLREAKARGADEVVITNLAGEITEAAVSNIHFVRHGAVVTPGLASGLLNGITRRLLIREGRAGGRCGNIRDGIEAGGPGRDAGMFSHLDDPRCGAGRGDRRAAFRRER